MFCRCSLSESECGGGTGAGSESQSPVTMGMQFGSLWGGANGDMLAGMYENSDDATNGGDEDGMMNAYGGSEASNDSNSNMQALAT